MTKAFALLAVLCSFNAFAASDYDALMLDCLDYGHSVASDEKVRQCHSAAKDTLLIDFASQDRFLSCIDYGHSAVSLEEEASCLRDL